MINLYFLEILGSLSWEHGYTWCFEWTSNARSDACNCLPHNLLKNKVVCIHWHVFGAYDIMGTQGNRALFFFFGSSPF